MQVIAKDGRQVRPSYTRRSVPSTCPKQGFAAGAGGLQRSGRWGARLRPGRLTGGARVLPKLAVRVRFPSPALTRTAGHEPAASPPRDPLAGGQAADAADLKLRPSAFEAPASRAVRFRGGDPERGVEGEEVQLPRRRSGARGAERRGERVALHLGRPPT